MSEDNGAERRTVGRYLLLDRLGRGGMGTVWRANDQLLERTVALKEMNLLAAGEASAQRTRRVHREARALARVAHPHVVDVYDLVTHQERLWLVMELVSGPSLAEHVASDGPLAPSRVAEIGVQLSAALDAVHAAGAVHRDVKPANVLLRADGSVVLCDFGVAALADTESVTVPGAIVGSLGYMAPERLTGRPGGPSSDLFSLGCTLCALLSGRSPFDRPEAAAVIHAVAWEQPHIPDRAGSLRAVLEALLRKTPEGRPSAAEAAEALSSVAEGVVPSGRTLPLRRRRSATLVVPRGRSPLSRRAALSASVLLAVSGAVGLAVSQWPEGSQAGADSGSTDRTPVDAVMPVPDVAGGYWLFSGSQYVRTRASVTGGPFHRLESGPLGLSNWTGTFDHLPRFRGRIDAVMPVPTLANEYWVFSGNQYVRVRVSDGDYSDELLAGPHPLGDWTGMLEGLPGSDGGIDAVMPTPDDPSQFWVFCGDRYVRVQVDGDGPDGHNVVPPLPLANWSATFGKYRAFQHAIDATMRVPDRPDHYWVFSGSHYIEIRLTGPNYADTLVQRRRVLPRDWDHLD